MNARLNEEDIPFAERSSHCLLIQVEPLRLIVPRILVAEVINFEGVAFSSSLNRDIRIFEWRGYQVPLVAAGAVNPRCRGSEAQPLKIVLLHGLHSRDRLPFYAIGAAGNPRLVLVNASALESDGDTEPVEGELCRARVGGEGVVVPDIDHLEKFIYSTFFH